MDYTSFKENLKVIDNSSLVDKVEANLVDLLQRRKLRVGDSIPKETELAESLGVSRTVVREALTRLKMMGLLESRKKKGAFITTPDIFSIMRKSMNPVMLGQETLKEIFEIRLMLEIGMADFIYNQIRKEDIDELKEIVSQEPEQTDSLAFKTEHEIAFHGKLYEITGNDTLKKFQKLLLPIFDYVQQSELIKKPVTIKRYVSHKGLVDTIENGSPELFRNAMRNHLENYFARLFD